MEKLNRKAHPEYMAVSNIVLPKVQKFNLSNGIPVHIINGGSQDVTKLDLLVSAGAIYSNHKLLAPLNSLMLNEGTRDNNAHQIAEVFDYYGAYFSPTAEKDNAFVSMLSLNKYLDKTLPVFVDALTESAMPEKELENLLDRRKNNFLIESEKTSFLAREAFYEQLFGENHPYGKKSKLEHYSEINRDVLLDFYKKHYQPANFELILSGKIDDSIIKLVEKYFGNLPIGKGVESTTFPVKRNEQKLVVIGKEDAVQSSIRMGFTSISKNHPDYFGLEILVTILGGYFGSRLMKNIREEKGYTYGIHAMLVSFQQIGFIAIAADVKAENTKEAISEIEKEMYKLQNDTIANEELSLVKNYMMGELLQALDGALSTSEAYKGIVQFGYGFSYYEQLKDKILNITAQELKDLANKYFILNEMTTVVAGKY